MKKLLILFFLLAGLNILNAQDDARKHQGFYLSMSIDSENSDNNVSTQRGFSMQLKIGKEWWISDKWAFGVGLTYGKTNLTNEPIGGTIEKLDSNRFGILFNTTLN
jgi:hypothetical protein